MEEKTPIRSFRDLEVYKKSYRNCMLIMIKILPKLPAFFDRTIFSWLSAGILVQAGGFGLVSCFVLYISEIS